MGSRIVSAGIIAAGEGSRFKKAGITIHKPLIPISSFPLVGHLLQNLESAGIKRVAIIFNESEMECERWIKKNFSRLQLEFIIKSTDSSFQSFWLIGKKLGAGRHLISTVDSFCLPDELKKMVQISENNNTSNSVYLGVTSFVDDEKPLWVKMHKTSHRILELGKKSGQGVTAGFYNVPSAIFQSAPSTQMASLREYLKWIALSGFPVYGVPLSKVVDVDVPKDIQTAEELLRCL